MCVCVCVCERLAFSGHECFLNTKIETNRRVGKMSKQSGGGQRQLVIGPRRSALLVWIDKMCGVLAGKTNGSRKTEKDETSVS
jgi:hypothetical protein